MDRNPVLRRDDLGTTTSPATHPATVVRAAVPRPTSPAHAAPSPQTAVGPHPDRLEVVRARPRLPRPSFRRDPRHRAPLPPRPRARPGSTPVLLALVVVATGVLAGGVPVPAPVAAVLLLVAVTVLGLPVLQLTRVPLPDPLARAVLAAATGLVLVTGLFRLADAAGWRPGGPTVAVAGLGLLTAALLGRAALRARTAGAGGRTTVARGWRGGRRWLPLVPLLALPGLAWFDVLGSVASPGWLRAAVLVAALVLLGRLTLRRRGHLDRTAVAATLYALAVAVLTPFAGRPAAGGGSDAVRDGLSPWTAGLARLWSLSPGAVDRVVLPAVTALVVVVAWLVAERVVGGRRAVVVAVLTLAAVVAVPPGPGDLAVTAAVLLVVTGSAPRPGTQVRPGSRARRRTGRRSLAGRRVLVLVLGAGALLAAPTAAVFTAQVCLAALAGAALRGGRRTVLTLPLAVVFAAAAWVAYALGQRLPGGTGPVAGPVVVLVALAAAGLLALLLRRVRRVPTDGEFLALAAAGLLVQAVATLGSPARPAPVPHVLLLLTVPAVVGLGVAWGALSAGLGVLLDRVPVRWLRSDSRATRAHRRAPARAARTALVALALFALEYGHRAAG